MTDHTDGDDSEQGPRPISAKAFVLTMTKPFRYHTQGLGELEARRLTSSGSQAFRRRYKSLDSVLNDELVRAYLGSVSSIPTHDRETQPQPLTDEQLLKVTEEDLNHFAREYLQQLVLGATESGPDPIASLAQYARDERHRNDESRRRRAELMGSSVRDLVDRSSASAQLLKHMSVLQESIDGPVSSLRKHMESVFGSHMRTNYLAEALGSNEVVRHAREMRLPETFGIMDRHRIGLAAEFVPSVGETARRYLAPHLVDKPFHRSDGLEIVDFPPLRLPIPAFDTESSPIGRTARAAEQMREHSEKTADAVSLMVQQVGDIADLINGVSVQVQEGAQRFIQESQAQNEKVIASTAHQARSASAFSKWSLAIALVALLGSMAIGVVAYMADRADAISDGEVSAAILKELRTQNHALRQALNQRQAALVSPSRVSTKAPEQKSP